MPPKKKNSELSTKEELLKLDKDDLIAKIIQLEAHNLQLKNIISKNFSEASKKDEREHKNKLDFSKCHFRRVLLRILYFGWDYNGLAVQEDTNQTIEHHLFHALTKSCLIQSRETSGYHRCGRTDKGVSSFGQVISISLRSKFPPSEQNTQEAIDNEMHYCKILNRLLPKDIKAVAWMPIPGDMPEYSARFDCKKRQYKYYFPRSNLDIQAMLGGCARLIGCNDYRNLCKMDVGNGVLQFTREIISARVLPVHSAHVDQPNVDIQAMLGGCARLIGCNDYRNLCKMDVGNGVLQFTREIISAHAQPVHSADVDQLDIQAMLGGCARLVGCNDYRNLCKMDVGNGVLQFTREIISARVLPVHSADVDEHIQAMLGGCARLIGCNDYRNLCKMDVGNGVLQFTREIISAHAQPVHSADVDQHIQAMLGGCARLVGCNDYRNLCKMDVGNGVLQFTREIISARAQPVHSADVDQHIQAMLGGCARLIGCHDYRNLCKMDVGNGVLQFTREIISARVLPVHSADVDQPTSMYYLNIEGNAFLWHQIRCIMGLLLLIGEGKETPDVITELLDVEKCPRKPQYNMALDLPLNLFHCSYDLPDGCKWVYQKQELSEVLRQLQSEWTIHSIKTTMIHDVINELEAKYSELCESETTDADGNKREKDRVIAYTECLLQGVKSRVYKPLLKRDTCSSLEERIEHYRKKRKIADPDEDVNSK